jgi:GNAT superfamily N-acetyltransferase
MVLRPIQPEDAEPISAAFELLNDEEVRRRFLHRVKSLDAAHLHQLTHPEVGEAFVVVAAEPLPAGEALVAALARLSRDQPGAPRAEFGILVSHFVIGLGLGRMLMERLVEWCRGHGVVELWGDVLEDNRAMLDLAGELGFRREAEPGSQGLVRVSLDLRRKPPRRRRRR